MVSKLKLFYNRFFRFDINLREKKERSSNSKILLLFSFAKYIPKISRNMFLVRNSASRPTRVKRHLRGAFYSISSKLVKARTMAFEVQETRLIVKPIYDGRKNEGTKGGFCGETRRGAGKQWEPGPHN